MVKTFDPGSDCTLRNASSIASSLMELVNAGAGVDIDCSGVEQADITFVQTVLATARSLAARDLPFVLTAAPASVRSVFERAGAPLPGAPHSKPSGN